VITEEQATMVRLAQQASASVIAVDDFPREQIEELIDPALKTGEEEKVEISDEAPSSSENQ